MTNQEENKQINPIKFDDLKSLFNALPDSTHLVVVGGQAVNFWYLYYHDIYPEVFVDDRIRVGTLDVDFLSNTESMEACAQAWGVDLIKSPADNITQHIGIVNMMLNGQPVLIDFLTDFVYPSEIKRNNINFTRLSDKKDLWVLDPRSTLISKIGNITVLRRSDPNSIGQLYTAMAVMKCSIMESIAESEHKQASSLIKFVLYIAGSSRIGKKLYNDCCIDFTDIIPTDLSALDRRFVDNNITPTLNKIRLSRQN